MIEAELTEKYRYERALSGKPKKKKKKKKKKRGSSIGALSVKSRTSSPERMELPVVLEENIEEEKESDKLLKS